jgi:hypothetical protein
MLFSWHPLLLRNCFLCLSHHRSSRRMLAIP